MEVVVAGGTGFIGSHLCRTLAGRGHEVTALSRSRKRTAVPDGINTVVADVTAYETLEDPLEDADAVVNLVALSPLYQPRGGEERHQRVHVAGTRNLVRACTKHDVSRFVQMSGLDASPDAMTAHLRAKGRAEGIVTSSDRSWVILRPSVVFGENDEFLAFIDRVTTPFLTGLPGGGRTPFQPIWVGDIVEMIADSVEESKHAEQIYEIGGPDVLTLADVTRRYHRARGHSVRIIPIPLPLVRLALTVAGPIPLVPFGREQYRGLLVDNTVEHNDSTAFGFAPDELHSLEAYLADAFG